MNVRKSTLDALEKSLHRRKWNCEERIVKPLDAFIDLHPELEPRSGQGRRNLYAAMRFLVEEIGEEKAPEFIEWADGTMTHKKMQVSSPRSYVWLFGPWRLRGEAKDDYEERGRYLRGELAE